MSNIYSMDDEGLLGFSNSVMTSVIGGLMKEGYLTQEQVTEIGLNYSVIIERKSWVPEFLAKFLGLNNEKDARVRLVKAIGRTE